MHPPDPITRIAHSSICLRATGVGDATDDVVDDCRSDVVMTAVGVCYSDEPGVPATVRMDAGSDGCGTVLRDDDCTKSSGGIRRGVDGGARRCDGVVDAVGRGWWRIFVT